MLRRQSAFDPKRTLATSTLRAKLRLAPTQAAAPGATSAGPIWSRLAAQTEAYEAIGLEWHESTPGHDKQSV